MSSFDEDEVPFDVTDEVEVGDLSDQQGGTMEAVNRVPFTIRKASVNVVDDKDTKVWAIKKLNVEAEISLDGIDGEGLYAKKVLFAELILKLNVDEFPQRFGSDWWKNKSRFPTKQFLKAMKVDITNVRVNDDFLAGLVGQEFIADIKKKPIQTKDDKGAWIDTGDFKNELANFRAAAGGGDS